MVSVNTDVGTAEASSNLPANWPASVTYTPFLIWESTSAAQLRLRATCCTPLPCVRIQALSKTHPVAVASHRAGSKSATADRSVRKQPAAGRHADAQPAVAYGLFARCALPAGTWIGDFTGQVKPQQGRDSSKYLLEVFHDPELGISLDVDAKHYGNETRFINDYTSLQPEPNVGFSLYRSTTTGPPAHARRCPSHPSQRGVLCSSVGSSGGRCALAGELAVGVMALRGLRCGDELVADYGTKFWRTPELKPHKVAMPAPSAALTGGAAAGGGHAVAGPLRSWESPRLVPRCPVAAAAAAASCSMPLRSLLGPSSMSASGPASVSHSGKVESSSLLIPAGTAAGGGIRRAGSVGGRSAFLPNEAAERGDEDTMLHQPGAKRPRRSPPAGL